MKSFTNIRLIGLFGVCIVFHQYYLWTVVRFNQVAEFNTAEGQVAHGSDQKITEETIRTAVNAIQKTNGLSPEVCNLLIKELVYQFNKIVTSASKNDTSNEAEDGRPSSQGKESTTQLQSCVLPYKRKNSTLVPLYIITPTYRRPEQIPELTRMAHTLMLVENVYWLVIEDAENATPQVTKLLTRMGVPFEHLVAPMPKKYKVMKGQKPRGVSNRLRGLQWIRANATKGVFYFADDDNSYDIDLFEEIRRTRNVSMFPVALCSKFRPNAAIIKNGKFTGWYSGWLAGRKFAIDMAGFAVSVEFLLKRPNATMPYQAGYEEDGFLRSLAPLEPRDIELLADNCTRILAWHTQTIKNQPSPPLDMKLYGATNLVALKEQIV